MKISVITPSALPDCSWTNSWNCAETPDFAGSITGAGFPVASAAALSSSSAAARRSSITCRISPRVSPSPTIRPDFVNIAGSISLTRDSRRSEVK